jgi:hypothetical protein
VGVIGRHRRNPLCNYCGKGEGEPTGSGPDPSEPVTLLIDLEEYEDGDRLFQAPRSPDNPLPQFLVWCTGCARYMVEEGDPITSFREYGHPDNSPDGPYAKYLKRHGASKITGPRRPPVMPGE